MKMREKPLVMMKMEVKTRVIVVVTTTTVIVDVMMMTVGPIVMTTIVEVMMAHVVEMIRVNPLVIEKMRLPTYSMRNMIVMWTIMIKTLKMMPKPTDGVTLILTDTG